MAQGVGDVSHATDTEAEVGRDSIGVRVVIKNGGVRLTIVGYKSEVYRKLAKSELERRVPAVKAEIRTHMQRSTK